jgi:hypothetical protein
MYRARHTRRSAVGPGKVVVGVNVYDKGTISQSQQDAKVDRMAGYGVKTIRTGSSAKSAYFITRAYQHSIGTVAVVYPSGGSTTKPKTRWFDYPLSQLDQREFAAWFRPLLDSLTSPLTTVFLLRRALLQIRSSVLRMETRLTKFDCEKTPGRREQLGGR